MELNVSPEAKQAILQALDGHDRKLIRFGLQGGGCSGFQYIFGVWEDEPHENDLSIDFQDFSILVQKKAVPYLNGTVIGYETKGMNSGISFDNPNVISQCGCANSISFSERSCG